MAFLLARNLEVANRWNLRPGQTRAIAKKCRIGVKVWCPYRLEKVWIHAVNQMKRESRPILLQEGSPHEVQHPHLGEGCVEQAISIEEKVGVSVSWAENASTCTSTGLFLR